MLLDTHTWAWSLSNNTRRLSSKAIDLLQAAETVFVSPISMFEIGQKVHFGKWPEMSPYIDDLPELLTSQGASFAPLTPEICLAGARLAWKHRDPFDRLLAATAIVNSLTYISADVAFDELNGLDGWLTRLW